jgi:putative FmdB family regulatory protein
VPLYDYKCKACSHEFSIGKRIADIDTLETCPGCKVECDKTNRVITKGREFYGEKPDEPFYSVALGKMVKGQSDLRRQAKDRGLIEIGNENVDTLLDRSAKEREKKNQDSWAEYTNPAPYTVRGA